MKRFQEKTQIHEYEDISSFIKEFQIGREDYILASKSIFETYLKPLNIEATIAFHSDYGKGEPTDRMIDLMLQDFYKSGAKRILAIGGGSVIDCAKLFVLKGQHHAEDFFMQRVEMVKDKTLIAIPTTCGSGSEVSNISIAEITSMHTKLGLAIDPLYPDHAILIPELLRNLPLPFFITSSIDAFIHASESFVSPKSNAYTEFFSKEAITLILSNFAKMAEIGADYRFTCLDDFMKASNYAGIAFANTGTGAVHALSYPLSGVYHVTHGEANYDMFTSVFKMYETLMPEGKIQTIMDIYAQALHCDKKDVFTKIEIVFNSLLMKKELHEYGMKPEEIETFTDSILQTQQRLLTNSYTPLSKEHILSIYKSTY